ncbi:MAG: hypothetical protein ABJC09_11010 [Terriglobia bacterium]
MQITLATPSRGKFALMLIAGLLLAGVVAPQAIRAQRAAAPPVAQVGLGAPLPVYVVNEARPSLPDGFVPGTSWKFTTWTVPTTLTFSATVEKTSGGWAYLTVEANASRASKWYYVPQMPGGWEKL